MMVLFNIFLTAIFPSEQPLLISLSVYTFFLMGLMGFLYKNEEHKAHWDNVKHMLMFVYSTYTV